MQQADHAEGHRHQGRMDEPARLVLHQRQGRGAGDVTNWGAEMGPPHGLQRSGWRRETLKIGEEVSVEGFLAKNGRNG